MTDKVKLGLVLGGILVVFVIQLIIGTPVEVEAKSVPADDLRLRVIAHSDDPADQVVKRIAVFTVENFMNQNGHTAEFLATNLAVIRHEVTMVLAELGLDTAVEVSFGHHYFPASADYYASLVVRLGDATGQNWWCFINPGICVVPTADSLISNQTQVATQQQIQASLGERALNFVGQLFGNGQSDDANNHVNWFLFADER